MIFTFSSVLGIYVDDPVIVWLSLICLVAEWNFAFTTMFHADGYHQTRAFFNWNWVNFVAIKIPKEVSFSTVGVKNSNSTKWQANLSLQWWHLVVLQLVFIYRLKLRLMAWLFFSKLLFAVAFFRRSAENLKPDEMMRHESEKQENLANELLNMAIMMKQTYMAANTTIKEDQSVCVLSGFSRRHAV